jgi:hypothetical protein
MANKVNINQLGCWAKIQKKAFPGNGRIGAGKPRVVGSDAAPDFAEKVGTLCWDVTNSNAYICSVAAGTWIKINA